MLFALSFSPQQMAIIYSSLPSSGLTQRALVGAFGECAGGEGDVATKRASK